MDNDIERQKTGSGLGSGRTASVRQELRIPPGDGFEAGPRCTRTLSETARGPASRASLTLTDFSYTPSNHDKSVAFWTSDSNAGGGINRHKSLAFSNSI